MSISYSVLQTNNIYPDTRRLILPLTVILTKERETIPASLLASQEYSPLSSSTNFSIDRTLLSPFSGLTRARGDGRTPFFIHLTSVVTLLTSQVNLSSSPTISVGYGLGVMWAVGFSFQKDKQVVLIIRCISLDIKEIFVLLC